MKGIANHPKFRSLLPSAPLEVRLKYACESVSHLSSALKQELLTFVQSKRPEESLFESALRFRKSEEVVRALIDLKEFSRKSDETPMSLLIRYGYAKYPGLVLQLLKKLPELMTPSSLAHSLRLLLLSSEDYSPTLLALIEEGLIDAKTEVDGSEWNLMNCSIVLGRNDLLKALLQKGKFDFQFDFPLHAAALTGNEETERLLLDYGFPPGQKNSFGHTPDDYKNPSSDLIQQFKDSPGFYNYWGRRLIPQRMNCPFQHSLPTVITSIESELAKTIEFPELRQKYKEMGEQVTLGQKVHIPLYARSLHFDLLEEYVKEKRLIYKHRGYSGLWFAKNRLPQYGEYTLWVASDITSQHPVCSWDSETVSFANSIDIKKVVQISCKAENMDRVRELLSLHKLDIPVVSHSQADHENTIINSLEQCVPAIAQDRCSNDYRDH